MSTEAIKYGASAYAATAADATFKPGKGTMSIVAKADSGSGNRLIYSCCADASYLIGSAPWAGFYVNGSAQIVFKYSDGAANSFITPNAAVEVSETEWHTYTASFDATSGTLTGKIYVDGVEVPSTISGTAGVQTAGSGQLFIGGGQEVQGDSLLNAAMWSDVLTDAEILSMAGRKLTSDEQADARLVNYQPQDNA